MKCPACSCNLRRAKFHNVEIDICTNCSGIWFDSGELQVFLRDLIKSEKIASDQIRLFQKREVDRLDPSEAGMKDCPKCGMVLKTFNYSYDSNVFVDKCPECEGIWTDAGEVRKLASYLKTDPRVCAVGGYVAQRKQYLEDLKEMGEMGNRLKRDGLMASIIPRIFLPVGDDIDREKFPFVTISIIFICAAVFLYELFGVSDIEYFVDRYGFIPDNFLGIGLITSMFLHADLFHIFGNMLFLWIFGDNVEDRFGRIGYVFFYLGSDIAASVVYTVFHMGSMVPCIGASGAISGVMGAYSVFYPDAKLKMFIYGHIVPVPATIYLTIWFLIQLGYSIMAFQQGDYGVAWLAHLGGFLFGMVTAYWVKKSGNSSQESGSEVV